MIKAGTMREKSFSDEQRKAFGDWMTHHYIGLMSKQGRTIDQGELSAQLEIERSLLNKYLNGTAVPGDGKTVRLANFFHDETIYDVLGYERPTVPLDRCLDRIRHVDDETFEKIVAEIENIKKQRGL